MKISPWLAGLLIASLLTPTHAQDRPATPPVAQRAFELRLAGHNRDARALLEDHLARHHLDPQAQFEYSRLLFYLFEFDSAVTAARQAVQADPDQARYRYWLGIACVYDSIHRHHRGSSDVFGRQVRQAIQSLEAALRLQSDYHQARFLLISLYRNNPILHGGSRSKARQHLDILLRQDPYYGIQARAVVERPEPLTLLEMIRARLRQSPDHAGLHELMAIQCARMAKMTVARFHLGRAIQLDRQRAIAGLTLARQAARRGEYDTARELIEMFLQNQGDQPAALRAFGLGYLANLERQAGHTDRAEQLARQIKTIDPDAWTTLKPPPPELFEPLPEPPRQTTP